MIIAAIFFGALTFTISIPMRALDVIAIGLLAFMGVLWAYLPTVKYFSPNVVSEDPDLQWNTFNDSYLQFTDPLLGDCAMVFVTGYTGKYLSRPDIVAGEATAVVLPARLLEVFSQGRTLVVRGRPSQATAMESAAFLARPAVQQVLKANDIYIRRLHLYFAFGSTSLPNLITHRARGPDLDAMFRHFQFVSGELAPSVEVVQEQVSRDIDFIERMRRGREEIPFRPHIDEEEKKK
jgi:hypothetical protein